MPKRQIGRDEKLSKLSRNKLASHSNCAPLFEINER